MAKLKEIIERVDELRPNSFSEKVKLAWLSELEGKIAADVMLMSIDDIRQLEYVHPEDMESEPLVSYPHQDVYVYWLEAKIDYANGEYNKYQNSMEFYNQHYTNFVRWFANTYEPAHGYPDKPWPSGWEDPPYYLTAYGLARKGGFEGSLEEWLASLKGEPGEQGFDGKSAYEYAVAGGYEGTEEDFAEQMAVQADLVDNVVRLNQHVLNQRNPHEVTAEQVGARSNTWMPTAQDVGARPNTWMPTAQDVGARPNTWTPTAWEVGARPNTWLPSLADIGAAPSGHGLGTSEGNFKHSWAEIDSVITNGWYCFGEIGVTINNVYVYSALVRVDWYAHHYGVQTLYAINDGSGANEIPVLKRSKGYAGWQPWECVNPPMVDGFEYRTTERYEGKPVYCKKLACGALVAAGNEKQVAHGMPGGSRIIRHNCIIRDDYCYVTLPIVSATGDVQIGYHFVSDGYIYFICAVDGTSYKLSEVIFWYVKD